MSRPTPTVAPSEAPVKRRRSGPSGATVPEDRRAAKPVLLRLTPETRDRLDAIAKMWGMTRSATVARLTEIVDDGEASPQSGVAK